MQPRRRRQQMRRRNLCLELGRLRPESFWQWQEHVSAPEQRRQVWALGNERKPSLKWRRSRRTDRPTLQGQGSAKPYCVTNSLVTLSRSYIDDWVEQETLRSLHLSGQTDRADSYPRTMMDDSRNAEIFQSFQPLAPCSSPRKYVLRF